MFLYTTTTIINAENATDGWGNALLDHEGNPVKRVKDNSGKSFTVVGTGTFYKDGIQSVYKRAYTPGVREEAKITIPAATKDDLLRLTIKTKLATGAQSDYVNFYYVFQQPLTVDILSSGTAADDAKEFARILNGIKAEYGRSLFVAKVDGADVTVIAKTNDQRFELVLEQVEEIPEKSAAPKITKLAEGKVTTPGNSGFGDDAWMLKSVQIPTYQNTRHFGTLRDERPVLGANYSQFTLRYMVKSGEDCVWDGDKKSVTTHVFWVAASQVAAFEAALETTLGKQIPGGIALTAANNATSLGSGNTLQLTVSGAIGNVTYASSDEDLATVDATGLVTAKTVAASEDVVLTATDSFGNVASITIEITA